MIRSKITKKETDYLKNHFNIGWLRPETALWDAIASVTISKSKFLTPSLDLGCGNGLFSFVTAGGQFSTDYDVFMNANIEGLCEKKDIYDANRNINIGDHILKKPAYQFTCGLDHKRNLLEQAKKLDFYQKLILHDANEPLPFPDKSFKTVFSNILYWLRSPEETLGEISRILLIGGRTFLCVPNTNFFEFCESYCWQKKRSKLLKIINRGRSESILWLTSYDDFLKLAEMKGFSVVRHQFYLSELTLKIWDFGLRPFSPYLINMTNKLPSNERYDVKKQWIEGVYPLLQEMYLSDKRWQGEAGFHFFELEKK